MSKLIDVIARDLGNSEQSYQFSWSNEEDWADSTVAILFKDDEDDEAQLIMTQEELLQFITDAASFLRASRK